MDIGREVFVGIDICKDRLDVDSGSSWHVGNSPSGLKKLVAKLQGLKPTLIVLESTGGYENALLEALWEQSLPVARVNPRRTKAFATSLGLQAKTDPIDARVLRQFASQIRPPVTPAPSPEIKRLKPLIDRRIQLIEMRTAEKNRIKTPGYPLSVIGMIRRSIKFMTKEIAALDKAIFVVIEDSPVLSAKARVLEKELGVGPVLLMTLLSDLPELGTISRERIAALVGVAPVNNQSGNSDKKRPIRGGRKEVRSTLYMATVCAVRRNPRIKAFYLSLLRKGKIKMVALIASMRRFIVHLNALLRINLQQPNVMQTA